MEVKILKEAEMVNWHAMGWSKTIQLEGNTIITGQSGTGKSTIMDAFQAAMFFNHLHLNEAAADDVRGLNSYIRCLDGEKYLRKGVVHSFIAFRVATVEDGREKSNVIFGLCLRSTSDKDNPEKFYFSIPNATFNDVQFVKKIDDKFYAKTWKEFESELHRSGKQMVVSSTQSLMKERFAENLGLTKDEFDQVCEGMLVCIAYNTNNLKNKSEFLKRTLLTSRECQLDTVKDARLRFKELGEELAKVEKQSLDLEQIISLQGDYIDICNTESEKMAIENLMQYNTLIEKKNKNTTIREREQIELDEAKKEKSKIEDEYEEVVAEKAQLSASDDKSQIIDDKWNKINALEKQLRDSKLSVDGYNRQIQQANELLFKTSYITGINNVGNLLDFSFVQNCVNTVGPKLHARIIELSKQEDLSKNSINMLSKEIAMLSEGKIIDSKSQRAIDEIVKYYKENNITSDKPLMLYQCLEIKEEFKEWQMALESLLGGARFYIIVDPQYFYAISQLFKEKNITGVSLIDTPSLLEHIAESSILNCFEINNKYARAYIAYKYGNYLMVDTTIGLTNKKERYIGKDGTVYIGKTYSIKDLKIDFVIGYETRMNLKRSKESLLNEQKQELNKIQQELQDLQGIYTTLSKFNVNNIKKIDFDNLDNIPKAIAEIQEEINALENDESMLTILEQIATCEKKLAALKEKKKMLDAKIETCIANIQKYNNIISDNDHDIEKLQDELNIIKNNNIVGFNKAQAEYYEYMKDGRATSNSIMKKYSTLSTIREKKNAIEYNLRKNRERYQEIYKFPYTTENSVYEKEYEQLVAHDLPSIKEAYIKAQEYQCRVLKQNVIKEFHNYYHFTSRRIKDMNKELELAHAKSIGGRQYSIVNFGPEPGLEKYMSLIKNYNDDFLLTGGQLSLDAIDNMNDIDLMDEFVELLMSDEKYKDCREFFRVDMTWTKLYDDKEDTVYYFSKVKGSGGEIQAPFYIASAIAIQHSGSSTKKPLNILLIDEAFSKMDTPSIIQVMEFLNNLGFQCIISIPDSKNSLMKKYGDNIYSMINNGVNRALKKEPSERSIVGITKVH